MAKNDRYINDQINVSILNRLLNISHSLSRKLRFQLYLLKLLTWLNIHCRCLINLQYRLHPRQCCKILE